LATLYVADRLSFDLDVRLVLADSAPLDPERALRGVHLTDGESVVVSINLQAHVTYEDCAPFILSTVAARGEQVPSLSRVILARNARSTICPDIALIIDKYSIIDKPIVDTTELERWMPMVIGAHTIAAQLAEDDDESDESYETDEDDDDEGIAEPDEPSYLSRACAEITAYALRNRGVLPTQNGRRRCRTGRKLQHIRSSRATFSPEEMLLVEAIPGWRWDPHFDKFLAQRAEFIDEIEQYPAGPFSPQVRRWIDYCVRRRRRGQLLQERVDALTSTPGWAWPQEEWPAPQPARRRR